MGDGLFLKPSMLFNTMNVYRDRDTGGFEYLLRKYFRMGTIHRQTLCPNNVNIVLLD